MPSPTTTRGLLELLLRGAYLHSNNLRATTRSSDCRHLRPYGQYRRPGPGEGARGAGRVAARACRRRGGEEQGREDGTGTLGDGTGMLGDGRTARQRQGGGRPRGGGRRRRRSAGDVSTKHSKAATETEVSTAGEVKGRATTRARIGAAGVRGIRKRRRRKTGGPWGIQGGAETR